MLRSDRRRERNAMDLDYTPEQERFRGEIGRILDKVAAEKADAPQLPGLTKHDSETVATTRALGKEHLLGMSWPVEYGGQGRSVWEEVIFGEEMGARGLQLGGLGTSVVGPTIMKAGTDEQKKTYLPGILGGEMMFSIAYTEPNAGTDLASLTSRAVHDGDDYVINGQKIYTSTVHLTTHMLVACRTDPDLPKHRGITMIIVPNNTEGVTIRPLYTQSGYQTNEVFFEDVRVPLANRLGEENQGWYVMVGSLNYERFLSMAGPRRQLQHLIKYAEETKVDGRPLMDDAQVRRTIARLQVDYEVGKLMSLQAMWTVDQGIVAMTEASTLKIWGSELAERIANAAIEIMGPQGILGKEDPDTTVEGIFEFHYRNFPMHKFGGGTNEVQREIIAQRKLGLPRG
jgi:alkylation response protein AidB-like acyl-CoA dehydrogenase